MTERRCTRDDRDGSATIRTSRHEAPPAPTRRLGLRRGAGLGRHLRHVRALRQGAARRRLERRRPSCCSGSAVAALILRRPGRRCACADGGPWSAANLPADRSSSGWSPSPAARWPTSTRSAPLRRRRAAAGVPRHRPRRRCGCGCGPGARPSRLTLLGAVAALVGPGPRARPDRPDAASTSSACCGGCSLRSAWPPTSSPPRTATAACRRSPWPARHGRRRAGAGRRSALSGSLPLSFRHGRRRWSPARRCPGWSAVGRAGRWSPRRSPTCSASPPPARSGRPLASFVGLTEVLFAVLFAWLLLGELPASVQLAGGVLIVAGVVAVRVGELPGRARGDR